MHFCERSEQALLWAARAGGYAQAMRLVLDHLVLNDVKTRDALAALDALDPLADAGPGAVGGPDAVGWRGAVRGLDEASADRVWQSSYGREWEFEYRPLRPGSAVSARFALACLQLFDPGFPRRHLAYAHRLASAAVGRLGSAAEVLAAAGFASAAGGSRGLARPTAATAGWTTEERLLARSFRLRPGRLVYLDIPPEALAETTVAELEQWCLRLMLSPGATAAPAGRCRSLLGELWQATTPEEYWLCCLERGFHDVAEAARLAGVFDLQLVERLARAQETAA
jgi:hypothetical protein